MTEMFEKLMNEGLEGLSLTLSEKQKEQFYQYYELLIEWNKVMNLTAITELDEVVTKHFVDSLLLVKVIPDLDTKAYKCIDVGTGAGFPGIPLKIAFPNLDMTLLDSLNKRVGFLNEVISKLGLEKIQAVHGRAEDYGRNGAYREQFDLCVSRAVANMSTLSEYCIPFVAKGGAFVPYKSGKVEEEVKEPPVADIPAVESVPVLNAPGSDGFSPADTAENALFSSSDEKDGFASRVEASSESVEVVSKSAPTKVSESEGSGMRIVDVSAILFGRSFT